MLLLVMRTFCADVVQFVLIFKLSRLLVLLRFQILLICWSCAGFHSINMHLVLC